MVLFVLSSVLAPLGLYETIVPSESELVEFEYVRDPGPWDRVTISRSNSKFTRFCEVGLAINCPGQFQGVIMNQTSSGTFRSVETDENSTINLTISLNFTVMFTGAISDIENTISDMFDIQYRR